MTYRMMIGFIFAFVPSFFCAIAFMTRKNTRTGATPFSALTKRSPKILTTGITVGVKTAIRIPMTKPTAICLINATLDKTFLILFSKVIPPLNYNNLSIPCVYISFKKHIKMICIRLFSIRF